MELLQKLKSLFGSDQNRQSAGPGSEPDVTVEREPAAESEHAVKGTDGADATGGKQVTDTSGQQTDESQNGDGQAAAETEPTEIEEVTETDDQPGSDEPAVESPSLDEIKGIGPTYADRLQKAGYDTVADLAGADAAAVADAAQTGEGRASDWIERAQDF